MRDSGDYGSPEVPDFIWRVEECFPEEATLKQGLKQRSPTFWAGGTSAPMRI